MNRCRRDGGRGSAAAEIALVTPLLITLALLVIAGGRVTASRGLLNQTAAQAARAATLARTPAQADAVARHVTSTLLTSRHLACRDINIQTGGLRPGGTVRATITCTIPLADLTALRLPGQYSLSATATSVVDTYRSEPDRPAAPAPGDSGPRAD